MKFEEAIVKLIYGKKVRRLSWDSENVWLESDGDCVRTMPDGKCVDRKAYADSALSLEDVLAEDWYVTN